MNKKILILSDKDDWEGDQPDFSDRHRFSYGVWGEYCINNNIELSRANWDWFRKDKFEKCWKYCGNGKWEKSNNSEVPNVVYDKCANMIFGIKDDKRFEIYKIKRKISSIYKFINCVEFNDLFASKLNQAIIFQDFIPKTRIVRNGDVIINPKQEKMVLKNFYGYGGFNVKIWNDKKIKIDRDYILQEYINGRNGEDLRDYRVVFVGEEAIYAVSRIAKKGSDYTNIHQGARANFVKLNEIPDVLRKCKLLIKKLEYFKYKNFSLDFLRENETGKIYLIEMNTKPGLGFFNEKTINYLEKYVEKLTRHLLD